MDMEVAGQWRREWAGTAEYGKVTEGGVTRRVARAMEVLNASAPGTRVRVVRAAYHSTAGPGLPAASCLMHSSRRVISSGFNILESPTTPMKPLEIASMPLDSTPDTEIENYKVTEPDDIDISEPSKWKSSTAGSVRMPSEESSSIDNASVIDLDPKIHRNIRKYSHDSESSDVSFSRRHNSRLSPILDTPVALSTLKYKSLLTGNNDWNNRRKSYSFEDTSPLSETIMHKNDTIAMDSSTDSGICKSSELLENPDNRQSYHTNEISDNHESNFRDWLSKNRPSSFKRPSYRSHDLIEDTRENSIALQSKGKISINVPITLESEVDYQKRINELNDDNERKVKKVGFCKTELHFAAESGKVNIISTDEKPPPTNDFRKRRSAFVPISGTFDKPITLFGENTKTFSEKLATFSNSAFNELDESMAATKSILKNKIPKPKPYLLGENMTFGSEDSDMQNEDFSSDKSMPTAVSMINKQLQSERRYSDDTLYNTRSRHSASVINQDLRTKHMSPSSTDSIMLRNDVHRSPSPAKRPNSLEISPVQPKPKTRELRDSDLTYFGINKPKTTQEIKPTFETRFKSGSDGFDDFHSVKLIQQVSSSCNSEAESEDKPEYENIPMKTNFAPIPIPKIRTKYDPPKAIRILRPVIEQVNEMNTSETRRSKYRRHEDATSSRSISAPPKINKSDSNDRRNRHLLNTEQKSPKPQLRRNKTKDQTMHNETTKKVTVKTNIPKGESNEIDPLYVNLSIKGALPLKESIHRSPKGTSKSESNTQTNVKTEDLTENDTKQTRQNSMVKKETIQIMKDENNQSGSKDSLTKHSRAKKVQKQRTEKLSTPDYNNDKTYDSLHHSSKSSKQDSLESRRTLKEKHEHRGRTSERNSSPTKRVTSTRNEKHKEIKNTDTNHKRIENNEPKSQDTKSRDKSNSRRERSRSRTKIEMIPSDDQNLLKSKEITAENSPKLENYKSSRRNEYVINYDDKNGTVSSICKVKVPESAKNRKYYKDNYVNDKSMKHSSQKNSLLQPEYHWITNGGINYQDRKYKKMHARTCQIL